MQTVPILLHRQNGKWYKPHILDKHTYKWIEIKSFELLATFDTMQMARFLILAIYMDLGILTPI